jgi:ribulose-5-phosphate 4-epimerase/fuculose-1-phosphate aldolase
MARKKTSAEKAREDAENEKVENMLDGAFGTLSGLEMNKPEENLPEDISEPDTNTEEYQEKNHEETQESAENEQITAEEETRIEQTENIPNAEETILENEPSIQEDDERMPLASPPEESSSSDSPSNVPPSGPPSGPPSKGPPSRPPSGPPSKGPPSRPPSGPPSKGPPSKGPPGLPPNHPSSEATEDNTQKESQEEPLEETITEDESTNSATEVTESDTTEEQVGEEMVAETSIEQESVVIAEEPIDEIETIAEELEQDIVEEGVESLEEMPGEVTDVALENPNSEMTEAESVTDVETEAEIARLSAEVERLRRSMAGAAEVIEELENPPMPPAIMDNLVIGAHIVGDMARLARQLDREQLIRASMGTIAMLHPDQLEIIVSTKHMALLPRMDERDICAAKLGVDPPRGAPTDWRVLEVVLASVSLITGGPAAVIHSHGPFTTAASCEKDLVLVQPIDVIGKKHIGKIIIVDPDDDNPEEFLRQVAEALQQGGMRCVVIRGKGAYAVGADLDQAWANAAMLEHSMKIVLLARQANLKV